MSEVPPLCKILNSSQLCQGMHYRSDSWTELGVNFLVNLIVRFSGSWIWIDSSRNAHHRIGCTFHGPVNSCTDTGKYSTTQQWGINVFAQHYRFSSNICMHLEPEWTSCSSSCYDDFAALVTSTSRACDLLRPATSFVHWVIRMVPILRVDYFTYDTFP